MSSCSLESLIEFQMGRKVQKLDCYCTHHSNLPLHLPRLCVSLIVKDGVRHYRFCVVDLIQDKVFFNAGRELKFKRPNISVFKHHHFSIIGFFPDFDMIKYSKIIVSYAHQSFLGVKLRPLKAVFDCMTRKMKSKLVYDNFKLNDNIDKPWPQTQPPLPLLTIPEREQELQRLPNKLHLSAKSSTSSIRL